MHGGSPSDICKQFRAGFQSCGGPPPAGSCLLVEEAGLFLLRKVRLMVQEEDERFLPALVVWAVW